MSLDIRSRVRGGPRAEAALARFFMDEKKINAGADDIFDYMRDRTRHRFESQGTATGGKWPDYTGDEKRYGVIKRKILGDKLGRQKLRWAPGMERLFPSVTNPNDPNHVAEVRGMEMFFGTKLAYAANHQYGQGRGPDWAGRGKIKQRKFLVLEPRDIAEIRRIMARVTGM